MLPSEITLVDIVRTNRWRRPRSGALITLGELLEWLKPYGRPDGLFWRIVPLAQPRPDEGLLRTNVLGHNQYRGYADAHVRVDDFSEGIGFLYHVAIQAAARGGTGSRDHAACRDDANTLIASGATAPIEFVGGREAGYRIAVPSPGRWQLKPMALVIP